MSARIRTSSLFSRKYDWIFCEYINPRRPRALHSHKLNEALLRMRKVLDESRPARRQRLRISRIATGVAKLSISKIPTKPGSKAEKVRIHRVTVDAPVRPSQFVRALEGGSRLRTSAGRVSRNGSQNGRKETVTTGEFEGFNKIPYSVRRLRATEESATPVKPTHQARLRGEELRRASARRDSSIESQEVSIGRYQTREEDPHKQTFRIPRHLAEPPENAPLFKPGHRMRLRGAATTATVAWNSKSEAQNIRILKYRTREIDPHKLVPILKVPTSLRIRMIGGPLNMEKLPKPPPKPKPVAAKPLQSSLKPAKPAIPLQPLTRLSQPDPPVKPLNLEQAQGATGANAEPAEPLKHIDRNQVCYTRQEPEALNRLSDSAKQAKLSKHELKKLAEALQREEPGKGFQKATTEKHSLLGASPTETNPSTEYAQEHVICKVVRAGIRKHYTEPIAEPVPPLKIRKHLSIALKDRPFERSEAQKVAEQAIVSNRKGTPQAVRGPKIIKYGSVRLRKHISQRPTFVQPVIDLRDGRFIQPVIITRPKSLAIQNVASVVDPPPPITIRRAVGFDSVPEGKGQPLSIKRPQNLVVQKIATSRKEPLEPPAKRSDSPLIRGYLSSSLYPIPTEETKLFSQFEPEQEPFEKSHPANTDHWTPTERIENAVEAASSKRLQRESWLTRNGDMRMAISLLFSSRSMANVQRLRWKYNPSKEKFAHFKVLRRLEIVQYTEYHAMLANFVQTWEPFTVKLNEPGHIKDKRSSFRVGLKLEFEKLEQLEQALLESVKSLPSRTKVNRRNTRDNDELGLMVIDGKIKNAQDAAKLVELLEKEHDEGLGSLRVEGLVLHGYAKGGDSLFPPPKEFPFPGVEKTIQKSDARAA